MFRASASWPGEGWPAVLESMSPPLTGPRWWPPGHPSPGHGGGHQAACPLTSTPVVVVVVVVHQRAPLTVATVPRWRVTVRGPPG